MKEEKQSVGSSETARLEKLQSELRSEIDKIEKEKSAFNVKLNAYQQAKADIVSSVARRISAAEEQIRSAEASAVKEVRDQAIIVAINAARDIIAGQITASQGNALIDDAILQVDSKFH